MNQIHIMSYPRALRRLNKPVTMVSTSFSLPTTCPLELEVEVLDEGELLGLLSAIELI